VEHHCVTVTECGADLLCVLEGVQADGDDGGLVGTRCRCGGGSRCRRNGRLWAGVSVLRLTVFGSVGGSALVSGFVLVVGVIGLIASEPEELLGLLKH